MIHYDLGDCALTLDELKQHLNIDYDDDDIYLAYIGKVAMLRITGMTNRTLDDLKSLGGGAYPEELRLAALQLAAHWYRVRESVSSVNQSAVPFGLNLLVKPFTKLSKDD